MKKSYFVFVVFIIISTSLIGQQDSLNVVYLKDGRIIRGVIIEQVPNKYIEIETFDKSKSVYDIDEIDRMSKEKITPENKIQYTNKVTRPNTVIKSTKKFYAGFSLGLGMAKCSNANSFINDIENGLKSEDIYVNFAEKPVLGVCMGLSFGWKIKKWLELQFEVNYMKKGMSYSGEGYMLYQPDYWSPSVKYDVIMRQKISMNYAQIPIIAKFISKPGLYLSIGPVLDVAIYSAMKSFVEINYESQKQRDLLKGYLNPVNTGILLGGGFQKKWFGIEIRYLYDFLDSFKSDSDDHHLKNQLYQCSLYFYPGKTN